MPTLIVFPDLLKAHVSGYTRSDGAFVQAHDDKRQAAAPKPAGAGPAAPKPGEVGHHEHTEYGAYFRPGDKVKDQTGKTHEVAEHRGASVRTKGGEMFHPTKLKHAAEPRLALPVKKAAAKPAPAKTGSAAPARMTNVGSDKYPLHAKTSGELPTKHADGSTHHVGGFEPPSNGKGDHMVQHDRKLYSFTGKSGKNTKTGEASYEYAHHGDSGEHRAWVTHSGHLMND